MANGLEDDPRQRPQEFGRKYNYWPRQWLGEKRVQLFLGEILEKKS